MTDESLKWENAGLEGALVLFDIRIPEYRFPPETKPHVLGRYERRIIGFRNPDLLLINQLDGLDRDHIKTQTPEEYIKLFEEKREKDHRHTDLYEQSYREEEKLTKMIASAYNIKR